MYARSIWSNIQGVYHQKMYRKIIMGMHQAVNYKYYKYKLYLHAYLFIKFKFINMTCYFSGFWHVCYFQLI